MNRTFHRFARQTPSDAKNAFFGPPSRTGWEGEIQGVPGGSRGSPICRFGSPPGPARSGGSGNLRFLDFRGSARPAESRSKSPQKVSLRTATFRDLGGQESAPDFASRALPRTLPDLPWEARFLPSRTASREASGGSISWSGRLPRIGRNRLPDRFGYPSDSPLRTPDFALPAEPAGRAEKRVFRV
jgi:hypothetical protein